MPYKERSGLSTLGLQRCLTRNEVDLVPLACEDVLQGTKWTYNVVHLACEDTRNEMDLVPLACEDALQGTKWT